MNNETLNKALELKREIDKADAILNILEKGHAVDISFNNGGYSCTSYTSDYLSEDEVAEVKDNITKLIRMRAQERK